MTLGTDRHSRRDLTGSSILVAAASPILAAAIAGEATRRGALVALATHDLRAAGAVPDDGNGARPTIACEQDVDRVIDAALGKLAAVNAVVAAIGAGPGRAMHETELDDWSAGVLGPMQIAFWLARRATHEFIAAGEGGRLVFVLEGTGEPGEDGGGNEIVEQALVSLARSIAKEYGRRRVTCNVVLIRGAPADVIQGVVDAILFLASGAASFVTGEVLTVGTRVEPASALTPGSPTG
jgi:3-oxoacyl-[acyl-carrier protein] reductase